ncbi:MAG: peptide chain release factor N(5)-glutamine methyltransferase [Chitinophagaceae bacterium]|nr:MAG: peptide chain release factor N(5)-glutamine methyltransferase [Chitinophagaceae bacterium]
MTIQEANGYLTGRLVPVYGEGEAAAMADLLLENITGRRGASLLAHREQVLPGHSVAMLEEWTHRLLAHEPIQYILGEAWFMGLKFYVDPSVLVPRPETEELVDWIIRDRTFHADGLKVLDIGTGSGCIPVTLKRKLAGLQVTAIDLSSEAIDVARKNAGALGAEVEFLQLDFLDGESWTGLPVYDLISSNPPYIPYAEKTGMPANVTGFEPAVALFVPDNNPLVFYKAIAAFGLMHLSAGGRMYVEIHEGLGRQTLEVFTSLGYEAELKKDLMGKDRMVRAIKKA